MQPAGTAPSSKARRAGSCGGQFSWGSPVGFSAGCICCRGLKKAEKVENSHWSPRLTAEQENTRLAVKSHLWGGDATSGHSNEVVGGWGAVSLDLGWDFQGSAWQKDKGTRELRSLVQEEVGSHRIFCGSERQWAWLIGRKGLRRLKVLMKLKRM